MAKQKDTEEKKINPVDAITDSLLKDPDVLNEFEDVDYMVSTGSLSLDIAMGGGIFPGITRLTGISTGGKTSEGFQMMQNFFAVRPKSRGIYFKTERLSKKTSQRIGVKVVKTREEWGNHVCLMFETNVYDKISDYIVDIINDNMGRPEEDREQFFIMVDSLDFLILLGDMLKTASEAPKVAGPQVITKKLLTKIILKLAKFGHLGVFTSQQTAQPKIDPYAKEEPRLAGNASGGNAIVHASDNILEFQPRYQKDYILQNPTQKPGKDNPTLGHYVTVIFRKSDNEKVNQKVSYPIKYGQSGGHSIWVEREVADLAVAHGFFRKKGTWLETDAFWLKKFNDAGHEFPIQIQGLNNLYQELQNNEGVRKILYQALLDSLDISSIAKQDEKTE